MKNSASFSNVFLDTLNNHALLKKNTKSESFPIFNERVKKFCNEKIKFAKDFYFRKTTPELLNNKINRFIITVDCMKKNTKRFSLI